MSLLKLTVEGTTAEELVAALLSAAATFGAAQGFTVSKTGTFEAAGEDTSTKKETATTDEPLPEEPANDTKEPKGRRGARNKAADTTPADDADADKTPSGRRSRGAKKEELVSDNEEQAALRAQLIVDLQDLADVEEAHGQVQEALQRVGAKSVNEVASAQLGDFNEDIQKLIAQYFD